MEEIQTLYVDCCNNSGFDFQLCESTGNGPVKFRGKFQEAEAINKNKRSYPMDVLASNVDRLQESIVDRRLVGELDHPTDSIIHFANASHVITKLWWEGNILMGEGELLSTPYGKILRALLESGVKVGISSRGVGSGKMNENGVLVIGESYKLITFDAVADPSTFNAYQKKIIGKNESIFTANTDNIREYEQKTNNSVTKNESHGIDKKVAKGTLVACLRGVVKAEVEQIKARLI